MFNILRAILYIPLFLAGALLLLIGIFIDNMTGMFNDRRLKPVQRIGWYVFHMPPKTCPACGDTLVKQGYNARYHCRRCDKDWANVGSF